MMNPFKYIKLRRDWRLVKILQVHFTRDNEWAGDVFYYLYENGLCHRKIKHEGNGAVGGPYSKSIREEHPMYLGKLRPWLDGSYDPDIPSYKTIKAKEFKDSLKGEKT